MKRKYLGDSYDAVKRLWCELLHEWAPLYAESRFIPDEIKTEFTRLTKISIMTDKPEKSFSILNDPDTGIRLPGEKNQREGHTHISISTIANQLKYRGIRCVVTFDQSYHRNGKGSHKDQRFAKMDGLRREGFHSLYYVSHAPFLFATPTHNLLIELKTLLQAAGIPSNRLEEFSLG